MIKKTQLLNVLLILLWSIHLQAQNKSKVNVKTSAKAHLQEKAILPLDSGGNVPDIPLKIYQNKTLSNTNLKEFRGKLIIIDFWGTDCTSCIEAMPRMLKLQDEFKDKVKILVVTSNSKLEYDLLWKKANGRQDPKLKSAADRLPFVFSDNKFLKLFPYQAIPMHVWIDQNGKFLFMSHGQTTNKENIDIFLKGRKPNIDSYVLPDINMRNTPQWVEKRLPYLNRSLAYSVFNPFDPKAAAVQIASKKIDSSGNKIQNITLINCTAVEMYRYAYYRTNQAITEDAKYVLFDFPDSSNYLAPSDNSKISFWRRSHSFCYTTNRQTLEGEGGYEHIIKDLNEYFGVSSKIETRDIKCWVFKRIRIDNSILTKGNEAKDDLDYTIDGKAFLSVINLPVANLFSHIAAEYISRKHDNIPVLYEGAIEENVDITIPWRKDNFSIDTLNIDLAKIGFTISLENRPLKTIVLSKQPQNSITH